MVIRHASLPPLADAFEDDDVTAARVRVLLPLPLGGAYDYKALAGAALAPGDFVRVPLGTRHINGVVWDAVDEGAELIADDRLKRVVGKLDVPRMSHAMRRFVDWVSAYTMTPPGAVLRMAMSVEAALERPRPLMALAPSARAPDPEIPQALEPRLTKARRQVLRAAQAGAPRASGDLARAAAVGTGVVRGMVELGWLETVAVARPAPAAPDGRRPGPALSAEQGAAATGAGVVGHDVTLAWDRDGRGAGSAAAGAFPNNERRRKAVPRRPAAIREGVRRRRTHCGEMFC